MDQRDFSKLMFDLLRTLNANREVTRAADACLAYYRLLHTHPHLIDRPEPKDIYTLRTNVELQMQLTENIVNHSAPRFPGEGPTY